MYGKCCTSCSRFNTNADNARSVETNLSAKPFCVNQIIKPRTDAQQNTNFTTGTRNGESLNWYDFGDWTHPYYHKSHGQSELELGLLSLAPTWNKPVEAPVTTIGLSKPLHNTSAKYEPLGTGYRAFGELDRIQPRYRYSRYTMSDPWTTSLHPLLNPLKQHEPISSLGDQHRLSHDYKIYLCRDHQYLKQKEAYEQQAMKQAAGCKELPKLDKSYNRYEPKSREGNIHPCMLQSEDITSNTNTHCEKMPHTGDGCLAYNKSSSETAEYNLSCQEQDNASINTSHHNNNESTAGNLQTENEHLPHIQQSREHSRKNVKTVSWADNKDNNSNNYSINYSDAENYNKNETDNNSKFTNCSTGLELKNCDTGGPGPRHLGCDRYRSMKEGRHRHFLDLNSEKFQSDIPVDYNKYEDNISYNVKGKERNNQRVQNSNVEGCTKQNKVPRQPQVNETPAERDEGPSAGSKQESLHTGLLKIDDYNHYKQQAEYYNTREPSLYTQNLTKQQNPTLLIKSDDYRDRVDKMRRLLDRDQLNYPYTIRGVTGYSGHQPTSALDLPLIKPPTLIPFQYTVPVP